ncbi:MAG: hypothetical protein HYV35_04085 [Lentisphaerae bacterium]|nr:hypothetical protein [Lentisphaerota bacterium]
MKKLPGYVLLVLLSSFISPPQSPAQSWTNLDSGMNGGVSSLVFAASGELYAGGGFTTAGGVAANYIAKWNPATVGWTNLGSGMNFPVGALALSTNGEVYAGGLFTNAGDIAANRIAKWNPATAAWTNLGSGMNSTVNALAFDTNGYLYAGGGFTNAGGVAANRIAKWNGTTWTNLGSGMNNSIEALAIDTSGNLYAGGWFSTAGGVTVNRIAKWNPATAAWTNLGSGMNQTVYALAFDTNGNLYAGGYFTTAGGVAANYIAKWDSTTAPAIAVTPTAFTNTIMQGQSCPSNTFQVWNSGGGTLTYSNYENVSWLGVTPTNGDSAGEYDVITINYTGASALAVGSYTGTVAIYTSGVSAASVTTYLTVTEFLSAPTNVAASDGTYTDLVQVTWATVTNATGYQVFRGTNAATNTAGIIGLVPGMTNGSYADTNVPTAGVLFYYRVKATNAAVVSSLSASNTGWQALMPPTAVAASDGTYTNQVRVTWSASSGASGYQVWRNLSNDTGSASWIGSASASPYNDTNVVALTNYYYWVKATNALGASGFSAYDTGWRTSAPTALAVSPLAFTNAITQGQNCSNNTFDVWNSGGGTLNYTLTTNASWLSAAPMSGTSTGEQDTITINYQTTGLGIGVYTGLVTVQSVSTSTVTVLLTVSTQSTSQSWTNLGSGMNQFVDALAIDSNGNLYAGGSFTNAGGVTANRIAKWNGTSWTNLGSGMNQSVTSLVYAASGNLYAGGDFTSAGGVTANRIAKWNGTSWTNLDSGMNLYVFALASDTNGNLYAGGGFTTASGVSANRIAKWNGTSWTNLDSGMNAGVQALESDTNGNLYAGGSFTNAGGVTANYIAKWNGTSWTNLGSGMSGVVRALASDTNGNLYAGGLFTNADGVAANRIAKWNGTSWTNLGSGMSGVVRALASGTNGNLYAGGSFTNAGGVAANRIAKWNGTSWTNLGSGMNSDVTALALDTNGNLFAGGSFTNAGGVAANRIAKWGNVAASSSAAPAIVVTPTAFTNTITQGQNCPSNTFNIWNSGGGTLTYSNYENISWLSVSPTAGASTGESDAITITYATSALNPGSYTGTVAIYTGGVSAATVTSYLTVQASSAPPAIAVAPTAFTNTITQGQVCSTNAFQVWNSGGGSLAYTNYRNVAWFVVEPLAGVSTGEHDLFTIYYDGTPALTPGSYTGTVAIYTNGGASPSATVISYLTVQAAAPAAPSGVAASDGTFTDKVLITWQTSLNATNYEVWRGTTASQLSVLSGQVTATNYADTTAAAGTIYYYGVKARNAGGTSALSSVDSGWRRSIYTITASADAHGSISPSGAVSVAQGVSQMFTILPEAGYHIAGVVVDGAAAGAVATYTFNAVAANHTIAASFVANQGQFCGQPVPGDCAGGQSDRGHGAAARPVRFHRVGRP